MNPESDEGNGSEDSDGNGGNGWGVPCSPMKKSILNKIGLLSEKLPNDRLYIFQYVTKENNWIKIWKEWVLWKNHSHKMTNLCKGLGKLKNKKIF